MEIFDILGAAFPPSCGDWGEILQSQADPRALGPAKFDVNRCNESPLRGEKPDFWPVGKNNTGSLPLRGNPAGNKKHTPRFRTYSRRALYDLPKLCTVIELVVPILKGVIHFWI